MPKGTLPELLAPAGNEECLHAAVCAGADAVYLGLEEFNARRNADNFTLENLASVCDYAHIRDTRIYVTLNVEILPSEIESALACAHGAYRAGCDAFIVQDAGLARELKRTLPQAELHASTQMNIHNAAGIEMAARLGMKRVTLARELSLPEIAELGAIAESFGMEIECFAHGALCVCYSGQCLMSSMIGGRSANRGLCAQACRLPYELHRVGRQGALPSEGDHLLSPRDLCTVGIIDRMCDAGIASLKIEGRMKSADYVYEVVSVYREALDEYARTQTPAHPDDVRLREARLAEAFSRGFTTAYLEEKRGNEIMSYTRPNNRGVFAGRVASVGDGYADVACEIDLNEGDVLEFWTNKGNFTATVAAQPPVKRNGKAQEVVRIDIDKRVGKGDRVFRVRNATRAFPGISEDPMAPRVAVSGSATIRIGDPALIRFMTSTGFAGEAWGDVVEPARTKPLAVEDVRAHIDRLGQTPFVLEDLDIELSEGAGMGFSQLHRLRAAALDALAADMLETWKRREMQPAAPSKTPRRKNSPQRACSVMAWATNPSCARAAKRAGAEGLYVPLLNFRRGQAQMEGVLLEGAEQAGYPKQCIMALPAIDHDPSPTTREGRTSFDPWDYVHEGKRVFADSLAGAIRALDIGADVELGPHVPLMNDAALQLAADMGIKRAWLSPELTLGQIAALAENAPIELGLFVCGAQELMICEHCLLMSQGPCAQTCETCPRRKEKHSLIDRKGFEFPVITDALGRSHLYNGIELDAVSALPDLVDMGITAIMVDTTLMDKKTAEAAVGRVAKAARKALEEHRAVEKRPGSTTGHLYRGIA